MNEQEKRLKKAIIKARKMIREKYKALKMDRVEAEDEFKRKYKPIIEPLKEIATVKSVPQQYKTEIKKEEGAEDAVDRLQQTPSKKQKLHTQATPPESDSDWDVEKLNERAEVNKMKPEVDFLPTYVVGESSALSKTNSPEIESSSIAALRDTLNSSVLDDFLEQYHPLPRQYLEELIKDTGNTYDTTYGVHYDAVTDKWQIGDSNVDVDGKDLTIKGRRYLGTPGLYELLFKSVPLGYKNSDLQQYREILTLTNAHKKNYNPDSQLAGNRGAKYRHVIKPLFTSERQYDEKRKKTRSMSTTGAGIYPPVKYVNDGDVEYTYWNKPSELVARLRLLHASQLAGNTSVGNRNEIMSIIEELQEEGIIE